MYKSVLYGTISMACILSSLAPYCYCIEASENGFDYNSNGRRDPFVPLVGNERGAGTGLEAVSSVEDLNLEGIAIGAKGKQVAILNGQMVKENDKFGSLLIKKISDKSIDISIEGAGYTLELKEAEEKNVQSKK